MTAVAAKPLSGRTVALAVTGGIAAYKAAELARLLIAEGADVRPMMTERASEFLGELTLETLTGHRVFTDPFRGGQEAEIGHIHTADAADLIVVAPATANAIARLAGGMADDAVAAVILASRAPLLLAPAMNVHMWEHPLTRQNLRRLEEVAGARTVGPGAGFLACRWVGPGRMAEPAEIAEAAARVLSPRDLEGRRIVVTAGPTHEPVDPARVLANRSSGKMGYALAAAALRRGADVDLISGPTALTPPLGARLSPVTTAREMGEETRAAARAADALIMAAAVADFRPREEQGHKLKKGGEGAPPALELEENPDILAALGAERAGARPILIGFAAETEALIENARDKLSRKRCDLVVANDVSAADAGFGADENRVAIVGAEGVESRDLESKEEVAHAVLDRVAGLLL